MENLDVKTATDLQLAVELSRSYQLIPAMQRNIDVITVEIHTRLNKVGEQVK